MIILTGYKGFIGKAFENLGKVQTLIQSVYPNYINIQENWLNKK